MNVFITGFYRSGTTLLRRIISGHPNTGSIFHEKRILNNQNLIPKTDLFWGEKLPYYNLNIIKYHQKLSKRFPTVKTIHIIRHQVDSALSIMEKDKLKSIDHPLRVYSSIFPSIFRYFRKKSLTIKYENLLLTPDTTLPLIWKYFGLDPSITIEQTLINQNKPKFKQLLPERAFAYKRYQNIKIKTNLDFIKKFGYELPLSKS